MDPRVKPEDDIGGYDDSVCWYKSWKKHITVILETQHCYTRTCSEYLKDDLKKIIHPIQSTF